VTYSDDSCDLNGQHGSTHASRWLQCIPCHQLRKTYGARSDGRRTLDHHEPALWASRSGGSVGCPRPSLATPSATSCRAVSVRGEGGRDGCASFMSKQVLALSFEETTRSERLSQSRSADGLSRFPSTQEFPGTSPHRLLPALVTELPALQEPWRVYS